MLQRPRARPGEPVNAPPGRTQDGFHIGREHERGDDSPDSRNEVLRQFTAIILLNESSKAPVSD